MLILIVGCKPQDFGVVRVKEPISIGLPETCNEWITFHNDQVDVCMNRAKNIEGVGEGNYHKPTYDECYPEESKSKVLQKIDEICPK